MFRIIFIRLMKVIHEFYKWGISPLLGNSCRFHPPCSDYCVQVVEGKGVIVGLFLAGKRLLRCNPLFEGGFDYPPSKKLRKNIE